MEDQPGADVDAVAASLRADRTENETFIEVLAGKLEAALPGMVEVTRSGGRFGKGRHVEEIAVTCGEQRFVLHRGPDGGSGEVEHRVRGIRLSGQQVGVDEWLDQLARALAARAAQESEARLALQRLLG